MTFELTVPQQKALDSTAERPPKVRDPRTNESYVLLPEAQYQTVRELLEHEAERSVISSIGLRNAAARINEPAE